MKRSTIRRTSDDPTTRIVTAQALQEMCDRWRRAGKTIVFTNGVFDILHRGHLELLQKAKSLGEILVVGLNSDRSVRRLKGPKRPLNPQRNRALLLAALRPVDSVCVFDADTPIRLIKRLRPNVLVKGAEYRDQDIVGASQVRSWNGKVVRVRMRQGESSSRVIKRLQTET